MQTAPADSTCSHSGILTCGAAREMTATTSGARAKRPRSAASRASSAPGLSSASSLALEDEEAPRRKLAVIGRAGSDLQKGFDLVLGRTRRLKALRRGRAAAEQQVNHRIGRGRKNGRGSLLRTRACRAGSLAGLRRPVNRHEKADLSWR